MTAVGLAAGTFVRVVVTVTVAVEVAVRAAVGVLVAWLTVKTFPATGRPVTWMGLPETCPCPVKLVALVEKFPEAVGERL
jgi:hypothetical protein